MNATILQQLEQQRAALVEHPLYMKVKSIEDIQTFTEHHVYAVWDFMSLLKALQMHLTCVQVPWVPSANPVTRRFINEIVFGEESDIDKNGTSMSHYEMYLDAMDQIGANTEPVKNLITLIQQGVGVKEALAHLNLEESIQNFVNFSFEAIATNKPHIIAAVFTFGREDLIPDMFIGIVKGLGSKSNIDKLVYYLERHIELDGDEHGPLSLKMIEELCGDDSDKWQEALIYSKKALQFRISLWDGIAAKIKAPAQVLQ